LASAGCLVLFFYPRDGSPVCTKEACSFRDVYSEFTRLGATVIGISGDSEASHLKFATDHNLPYHLVSDESGKLKSIFGIKDVLGLIPGRATFVIDKEGVVRGIIKGLIQADKHVDGSLDLVKQLVDNG